jgi:hypothetical protein
MNAADTMVSTVAVSTLKRIARKPWPEEHTKQREFYSKQRGEGYIIVRAIDRNWNDDPLWMPEDALGENNPCDCPKCLSLRALFEMKQNLEEFSGAKAS